MGMGSPTHLLWDALVSGMLWWHYGMYLDRPGPRVRRSAISVAHCLQLPTPKQHVSPAAVGWLLLQTNGVICLRLRQHHFWRFASVVYLPFCVPSSPNVSIVLWCGRSTVRRSINLSVSHIPLGTRPTPCRYCVP